MSQKAEYLVVDSGGFIKNAPLRDLAANIVTLSDVVVEIRDKETRQRLEVLPYELDLRQPTSEGYRKVTEFAKKTGDYSSLSATDLSVLAVTYDLEALHVGTSHLRSEPIVKKSTVFYQPEKDKEKLLKKDAKIAGFFLDKKESQNKKTCNSESEDSEEVSSNFSALNFWKAPIPELDNLETFLSDKLTPSAEQLSQLNNFLLSRTYVSGFDISPVDFAIVNCIDESDPYLPVNVKRWLDNVKTFSELDSEIVDQDRLWPYICHDLDFSLGDVCFSSEELEEMERSLDSQDDDCGYSSEDADDDDDSWITPGNVKTKKKEFGASEGKIDEKPVVVACMTTDFAMQNVLKSMGLNILGTDGMVIKETKTWIMRCYGCFWTTSLMDKKFCGRCGNKTMKRVSVTLNNDGSQQIHISTRRPLSKRGKKFSLPAPKGGKYGVNPRMVEDQRYPHQRISKKALIKTNPMGEDYMASSSPFCVKDVTSKSAMLGLHGRGAGKGNAEVPGQYWARKNPNQVKKNTGNKKK